VTIELEDGLLQTQGELTIPAVGQGPFPGVLLIHGAGPTDRNGYIHANFTGTGNTSTPLLQIAEYLSDRGFVVLRYDKRGVEPNMTITDLNIFGNITFEQTKDDAERALNLLIERDVVNENEITIIGYREGAIIVPHIAIDNPGQIENTVLMSASAHNLRDILYGQLVNRTVYFAHEFWDTDGDGFLTFEEVLAQPDVRLTDQNETTGEHMWPPGLDMDGDGRVDIDNELEPFTIMLFEVESTIIPWYETHFMQNATLDIIDRVASNILILQGEADIQTPVEEALLLEQKLTRDRHQDHTLITYPGLGHTFYQAEGMAQPLGPIEEQVLADLHSWLKERYRHQQDVQ
jgi:uncharacterized protein